MIIVVGFVAQLSDNAKVKVIGGLGALIVMIALALAVVARNARINRKRRAGGRRALPWRTIADTNLSPLELQDAGDDDVLDALVLARQIEWEREQAAMEMAKYGRSQVRAFCTTHQRWCRFPERGAHPPGGFDNEAAPATWRPAGEGPIPTS